MDIQHKHSGFPLTIRGMVFTANDAGMWDVTEIHQSLNQMGINSPAQWRSKASKRFRESGLILTSKVGMTDDHKPVRHTFMNLRALLEYVGWADAELYEVIYDTFEAILESPEVASIVNQAMTQRVGYGIPAVMLKAAKGR